jgi:PAS domain S-box-containing protein
MIASVLVLILGVSIFAWMYHQGVQSLSIGALPLQTGDNQSAVGPGLYLQFDRWVIGMLALAAVGGLAFLFALLQGIRAWQRESILRLEAKDTDWRRTIVGLEVKLSESRNNEAQLHQNQADNQQRMVALAKANELMRTELDQLKRAEKTLSQQRQVLQSSKTVLELHVETRTKELDRLQRRYEMILNSAGEGICGFDTEGKATFVNPAVARITGRPIAELIGGTESEIFGWQGSNAEVANQLRNPNERVFYRKDGSCFPVEFVKTPINEQERVIGSVVVFRDITERRRIEDNIAQKAAELARSNSELEQFAFVASHDLQEPLRKIQAFGDRLKTKCEGILTPESQDYLQRMQSAAARMRTLIDDLLAFSRVIRSSEPFVPVDLTAVTREVIGDLEVRVEKTAAQIHVGELPTLEADPLQIRQLMLNLLGNALKFQPPGGQPVIRIESRKITTITGEQLHEITVQDNGIGFEEKYLDKVFAVFQRLHGRTEYEGTGVGLAVCRRITDRHHGTITAKSQLGKGATFIVTLPACQPKPKSPQ